MTTYLSPHFSLEELTQTLHRDLDNTPSPDVVKVLKDTATRMEDVRTLLGGAISVNSAYRSPAVNKAVGGVSNSAHLTGHAVDFNCFRYGTPLAVCEALAGSAIQFDQVIQEGTWIHISFAPAMRRQVLTKSKGGYSAGLAA